MTTSTRRQFLQTTTLGLAAGALSGPPSLGARQAGAAPAGANIIANIIDCHAHWVGPSVVRLLGTRTSPRPPQGAGWTDVDARLREMDKTGVKRQVLGWVGASFDGTLPAADARPLWRAQNDDVAAVVKQHPARFSGLASLPTANVTWAAEELERAHTDLGLIGAVLPLDAFVSLAGARALSPIFDVAQKHHSHIFVHRGAASPDIPGQQPEAGAVNPYFGLGEPAGGRGGGRGSAPAGDYTQARTLLATAAHLATGVITLALTDFLDAYPNVTVQVAMMGGAISYVAEHIQMAAEEAGAPVPAKRFKSVYLDTGQSGRGPRGIALAAKVFGADRILFGTDSGPTSSIGPTIESVKQAALTAEEKALIFSGNGRRLLTEKGVANA
jgi:predicted TIM-barrel fold metal-dependent hydrolase